MKKSILVTLTLAVMVILSFSFTKEKDPDWKNLKKLPKNITKEQMDSVMHHFCFSLGVRCNFCHVHNETNDSWDFPSDENKHKLAARNMMEMMQKINDKYFNVTDTHKIDAKLLVTCYTCHHGSNEPATSAPIPMRPPQMNQRPPASDSANHEDSTRHNQ